MTTASSETQQRRARQRAREDRAHTENAIRLLMKSISGRRWLWLLMEFTGPFQANFHNDPFGSARQEGLRIVGLRILAEVQRICPQEYLSMTTENTGVQVAEPEEEPTDGD